MLHFLTSPYAIPVLWSIDGLLVVWIVGLVRQIMRRRQPK